ncbi:MAG: hypothetical protein O9322_02865 [Beijerinckiaceae bacterium]|nr:hypothetical protein [Beijerinckiaceae bacterium]MCZ8301506.1 hypothetical protein [Beijerinckiaceae bacterium]
MKMLCLAATATISLLVVATASAKPPSSKVIAEWLPLLPAEVFDNTTEGIEAEELAVLRKKGTSENWKARRVSATKYLATAKRPSSEVHMTLRQNGAVTYLEVLTYNEKAVTYSYWQPDGDGEPLKAYDPGLAFRALKETGDSKPGPADATIPEDIRQHLGRLEACLGVKQGLKADIPAARRQQLVEEGNARQCDGAKAAHAAIVQRYANKPVWPAVLDRAGRLAGE